MVRDRQKTFLHFAAFFLTTHSKFNFFACCQQNKCFFLNEKHGELYSNRSFHKIFNAATHASQFKQDSETLNGMIHELDGFSDDFRLEFEWRLGEERKAIFIKFIIS